MLPHAPGNTEGNQEVGQHRYIATQGPKSDQLALFWNMVFHETESTGVVVMLTNLVENGFEKCATYFPLDERVRTFEFDSLATNNGDNLSGGRDTDDSGRPRPDTVTLVSFSRDDASHIETRELKLTIGGVSKRIWHFYFTRWPDHDTPSSQNADSIRKLACLSAQKARSPLNPRIVHCSAGVGRTGTFIALDHLLAELDAGRLLPAETGNNAPAAGGFEEDPIYRVVNQLREQRAYMVFNESQYKFLYHFLRK